MVNQAVLIKQRQDLAASKKVIKAAAKAAELARRMLLTDYLKKAEDDLKRAKASEFKEAKLLAREQALAHANLLLG